MPYSKCSISTKALGREICSELDDMNNSGFGSSVKFMIGEWLGFQVQVLITRDVDDFLELNDDEPLIKFSKITQSNDAETSK